MKIEFFFFILSIILQINKTKRFLITGLLHNNDCSNHQQVSVKENLLFEIDFVKSEGFPSTTSLSEVMSGLFF